jgi:anti-sigma regulatory factor (Ser/Thr protein kinase)
MHRWRRHFLATDTGDTIEGALVTDRIQIPAHPEQISHVYALLARFSEATKSQENVEAVYSAFMTAVVEIATNIMRHAYPPGASPGEISLALALYAERLEARFYDQGVEFELHADIAPNLDDPLGLPEGGYGLFIARQALDTLEYQRTPAGENRWTLVKKF